MNVQKEITSSICHFIKYFKISVEKNDLSKFYDSINKKRSISRIPLDVIYYIEDFLLIPDVINLVVTCREMYSRIDEVRLKIVSWNYSMHTLPRDPTYQWKNLCLDWLNYEVGKNWILKRDLDKIKKIEATILYCQKELDKIYSYMSYDPLPQTSRSIRTYKSQIICEKKLLDHTWKTIEPNSRYVLDKAMWIVPSGFISDLPDIDEGLYGGMTKTELNRNLNNESDYDF